MNRRSLIGVSVGAHLAIGAVWFVNSVWTFDRLNADYKLLGSIAVSLPAAAEGGGGSLDQKMEKIVPKRKVTHDTTQPAHVEDQKPDPTPTTATPGTGGGQGPGTGIDPNSTGTCVDPAGCGTDTTAEGPVCGNGTLETGEQCDDGNVKSGDGCSATCAIEQKKQQTQIVPPTLFAGLRISGETQVHPSEVTKQAMIRDARERSVGSVKVCLDTSGNVASATMQGSTKYPEYDALLLAAVREWHYKPYLLDTQPVAVCSVVTFKYQIK